MTSIDGSHDSDYDGKGNSGMFIKMGKGAMMNASKKLGITSSTETERVSTGKRFPKFTWFRYFRIAEGDEFEEDSQFQDNTSHALLCKNYPFSIGKGTNNVNVRCFFVVDKIEKKELKALCCPTECMIADNSTKPMQGGLFVRQRSVIQGVSPQDIKICEA